MDASKTEGSRNVAKPICVIRIQPEYFSGQGIDWGGLTKSIGDRMPDYHVFVLPNYDRDEGREEIEFQVFYEKDQQPISYDKLMEFFVNSLKQPNDKE